MSDVKTLLIIDDEEDLTDTVEFKFKAGGNQITMAKIIEGQFCGACHNGEVSWSVENCDMCHSGIPGQPTHFHGSTVQRLIAPPYQGLDKAKQVK